MTITGSSYVVVSMRTMTGLVTEATDTIGLVLIMLGTTHLLPGGR